MKYLKLAKLVKISFLTGKVPSEFATITTAKLNPKTIFIGG